MEAAKLTPDVSIVQKLLKDVSDTNVTVASLLRTAKIIATKLKQDEALVWIDRELNGYPSELTADDLPKYRKLSGTWRAHNPYHGWQSIHFPTPEAERLYSMAPMSSSVVHIENGFLRRGDEGSFAFNLTPEKKAIMCEIIGTKTEVQLGLDSGHLYAIVDKVRNMLLDWALELEKAGVAGIDMDFTAEERKEATVVTQQVFNIQNAGVVGNICDQANVTNNQSAIMLDVGAVIAMVRQARTHFGSLPVEQRNAIDPVLSHIEAEAAKKQPNRGLLRELLTSARSICEGAIGNLTASGIAGMISSILGT